MKVAIWGLGFIVMFVVKRLLFGTQSLGAIGEAVFWSVWLFGAPYLCKRWDKRKKPGKEADKQA